MHRVSLILLVVLMVFLVGCDPGVEPDSSSGDVSTDKRDMLEALGIDVNPGNRLDAFGNELDDGDNPYGESLVTLMKAAEIFTVGSNKWTLLEDNSQYAVPAKLSVLEETNHDGPEDDWILLPKKSLAIDMNRDGFDEVVILIFNKAADLVYLRVMDFHNGDEITREYRDVPVSDFFSDYRDGHFNCDMAGGDVNGDGQSEILFFIGNRLYLIDDSYTLFGPREFSHRNGSSGIFRLEVADIDEDNLDEVITVQSTGKEYTSEFCVFDGISSFSSLPSLEPVERDDVEFGEFRLYTAELAAGDYDGDGAQEIAFGGLRSSQNWNMHLLMMQPLDTATGEMAYRFTDAVLIRDVDGDYSEQYGSGVIKDLADVTLPTMAAGDFDYDSYDGLKKDELYCFENTYCLNENGEIALYDGFIRNEFLPWGLAVAEDIDGNGRDELICADCMYDQLDDENFKDFDLYGINPSDDSLYKQKLYGLGDDRYPALACPNIDEDSVTLKYRGTELAFSDPIIMAVIASPPYWDGVEMNENAETSLQFSDEVSYDHQSSAGFHTGVEFSVGVGVGDFFQAGQSWSLEESFTWGYGHGTEKAMTYGYALNGGNDEVIFTALTLDIYLFEILCSPDEEDIGEYYTLTVPREAEDYHLSVSEFNRTVPENLRITDAVLCHTPGNPLSYADEARKEELEEEFGNKNMNVYFSEDYQTTGQGNSTTSLGYSYTSSNEFAFDYELSYSITMNMGVIAGVGMTMGHQVGYSFSNVFSNGIEIAGTVGDFTTTSDLQQYGFKWGLMMYPCSDTIENQEFSVLTYWVDDM